MRAELERGLGDRLAEPMTMDQAAEPPAARGQDLRLADIARKYARDLPPADAKPAPEPAVLPAAMRGRFGRKGT